MKLFLGLMLLSSVSFAVGRIQNSDVKSLAELQAVSGTAAQLINDSKIYVTANGLNKQLSTAIADNTLFNGATALNNFENFVINPYFEVSPTLNWTSSGVTVVSGTYAFPTANNGKFTQITGSTSGGAFTSNIVSAPTLVASGIVFAYFDHQAVSGTWRADIFVNGLSVASQTLTQDVVFKKSAPMYYRLPAAASGTATFLRFTQLVSASVLRLDNVYYGTQVAPSGVPATSSAAGPRFEFFTVSGLSISAACTAGTCNHFNASTPVTSTRAGAGNYSVFFGIPWSSPVTCTCSTGLGGVTNRVCAANVLGNTAVQFLTTVGQAATQEDNPIAAVCFGFW